MQRQRMKCYFFGIFLVIILFLDVNNSHAQAVIPKTFEIGETATFMGIFTHTEPVYGMDRKIQSLKDLLTQNPYISGITLKIWWEDFHPEKDKIEWGKLEELIEIASSNGLYVRLAIWGGYHSPDWVYEEGCKKLEGPLGTTTVPWDKKFMELFSADIKAVATHYANDPRVFMIGVLGHNFKGEEMHAPSVEYFKGFDWSEEIIIANWKYWIDLYDSLYPTKKLNIVVSQMYPGKPELPGKVVAYFLGKCSGRAVLQTDQLNGREAKLPMSGQICKDYYSIAPNGHETVGSFKEQPERQGTPEMTIYKLRLMGNPLFIQLWRRDCTDPQYCKSLLDAMDKYKCLLLNEMKHQLIEEGLYIEESDYKFRREK